MNSDEKSPPAEAGGPLDRIKRLKLALAALLAGLLLTALLTALTARILLLLSGFLLIGLSALILIHVRHWKRLLIAG